MTTLSENEFARSWILWEFFSSYSCLFWSNSSRCIHMNISLSLTVLTLTLISIPWCTPIIPFILLGCWYPFHTQSFVIPLVIWMCHSALNGLWHSWQINEIPSGPSFLNKPDIKRIYSRWTHWLPSENKWHTI